MYLNFSAAMINGVVLAVTVPFFQWFFMVAIAIIVAPYAIIELGRTDKRQIKDSGLSEYKNNFFILFHVT